jgi:glucokinase
MIGLIADIGGTNARFALVNAEGVVMSERVVPCDAYPTLLDACRDFLSDVSDAHPPRHAAFAVASPVVADRVKMTNHHWSFSIEETRRALSLENLRVVNDFLAVVLAIPHLREGDRVKIGGGEPTRDAPIVALGPGTGLGMASLVPSPTGKWIPVPGEGGHVTMAPADDLETAVLSLLRKRLGHVSAERVISGRGLVTLYKTLGQLEGLEVDEAITPPECSRRALDGSCDVCARALSMMCAMLGTVAANAALMLGAQGGVFIAGGIIPQMTEAFARSPFRKRFEDKGRFGNYLAKIPTFVITRPLPALLGLATLVAAAARPDEPS